MEESLGVSVGEFVCPLRIGVPCQHPSSEDLAPKGGIQILSSCVKSCMCMHRQLPVEAKSGHLKLDLQVVVNSHVCLGIKSKSSARVASGLRCSSIPSLQPSCVSFMVALILS